MFVTVAVVKIGSSSVRLACGTNRSVAALAGWAMAGAASRDAAAPCSRVRRCMSVLSEPDLCDGGLATVAQGSEAVADRDGHRADGLQGRG